MAMINSILLVEDNPDDVELVLHAFNESHLVNNIVVVRDGAEALEYLFAEGRFVDRKDDSLPTLILLDLRLPKIDGLQVLRSIREDERTKRLPVVILTTSDDENDIATSYDRGVNSYIRKPVDFDKFVKIVKQLGLYWLVLNTPPPS